jgi:arylsulfatase A
MTIRFLLALSCLILWFPPASTSCPAAEKPNVVLILADDMALGDLSSLNGGLTRTPHLDRLKQNSVWFRQAYSAAPVCAPARAALLTGRYPHRTGVVTLNQLTYPELTSLKQDEVTIADVFRTNGYRTGLIGKWHCGLRPEYHPHKRGFDEFKGFINHKDIPHYDRYRLRFNDRIEQFADQYLTDHLGHLAIEFIRRHQNQPFFLHLAHYAPHRPIEAPEKRIQPYLDRGFSQEVATVYAMIEILDENIGELLQELERLELSEQTIVLFASDNGPDPLVESRFNLDVRGTKYTVYEGGIRVPFLVRWKEHFSPGESQDLIHFTDVLPTLIELCELETPQRLKLDGVSFASVLRGKQSRESVPRYWQWNRGQPRYSHNAAVRQGNWKLVRPFVTRNLPKSDSTLPPLLFDLSADPGEPTDVSQQHPERVRQMQDLLKSWCRDVEQSRQRE